MAGKSLDKGKDSVNREFADAASACHSFWDGAGREAGATGAWLSAGLAQQAGVWHFPSLPPQHLHTNGAGAVTTEVAE